MVVDDAKDTIMLLDFDLSSIGYRVITAECGEDALEMLNSNVDIDLILLDMYMPGKSGIATLKEIKEKESTKDTPVIMLSASDDEDEIVTALEHGASDYVTKPYIAKVLLARIKTAIRLKDKTKELERLARTDYLTEINNRGSFEELAEKSISQCHRYEHELAIAMFDIDYFKQVNDQYGHEAGDKVLVEFAKQLVITFRECDIIARIGGEEFAVCMPNTSIEQALVACERLRTEVSQNIIDINEPDIAQIAVTVSCGVVSTTSSNYELSSLLRLADIGLYQAKNNGRNNSVNANNVEPLIEDEAPDLNIEQDNESDSESDFPGIDMQIGVENVLGDESLFQEILLMFYQDHKNDKENIQQALNINDFLLAKHLSHTLKGVAASIGATPLFEECKALDNALNEQEESQYQPLFERTAEQLTIVLRGIETKLADKISA